jgi:hypothetical protein
MCRIRVLRYKKSNSEQIPNQLCKTTGIPFPQLLKKSLSYWYQTTDLNLLHKPLDQVLVDDAI